MTLAIHLTQKDPEWRLAEQVVRSLPAQDGAAVRHRS
jgi:hypothetical protein